MAEQPPSGVTKALKELNWFCCLMCRRGFVNGLSYSVSECGHIACSDCHKNAGKFE